MIVHLVRYFLAESLGAQLLCGVGLVSILAALVALRIGGARRAAAIPLVLFGLIEAVVGGAILSRTDAQVNALAAQLETAPEAYQAAEQARMAKVLRGLKIATAAELVILAVGMGLAAGARRPALKWLGYGSVAHGVFALLFDGFARHRAEVYVEALARMSS